MWQFEPAGVCSHRAEHPGGLPRDRRVISASGEQLCPLPSGSAGKTLKDPFRLGLQPSPKQNGAESMGTAFGNASTEPLPPKAALPECH